MESFDPVQTRYAGNEFRRLFEITAGRAAFTERPNDQSTAISALGSAILRIDPSGSTFTSSHLLFVHLCLLMRAYPESLPVLDHNIYHFTSNTNRAAENNLYPHLSSNHENSSTFIIPESGLSSKLDYRSHLLFFLYGAMCYMGLKEWKRALLFLEIVIMSPISQNASRIQVEAYKKYILVGILYKGSVSLVGCSLSIALLLMRRSYWTCQRRQIHKRQNNLKLWQRHMKALLRSSNTSCGKQALLKDWLMRLRLGSQYGVK